MTTLILDTVSASTGTPPAVWLPQAWMGGISLAVAALMFGCLVAVVEWRRA